MARSSSPADYVSEKAVPAIIVWPSSPLDATDYQIQFLPLPPKQRRRPLLAPLFQWRFRRTAPIQLPTSAHETSFPIGTVPSTNNTRRNRVLFLLAIPLVILVVHFLMAFAASASRTDVFPAAHTDDAHGSFWNFLPAFGDSSVHLNADADTAAVHPHAGLALDPSVVPVGMVDVD